ncbi:monooxygenase [Protofrankia coriariae]|uniref:Monooxygenase n=1 Tax=Protofrankia coriariae TaxID=1562887 RepID=A0ABR5F7X7_9ACTN|nr:monooxygenase [Protofrankia coriariae]
MHLNANVLASGRHDAAWRLSDNPRSVDDVDAFCEIARIAERGTFDAVFFADGPQLAADFDRRPWHSLDPVVLLAAMARATERVGLVATASTTFNEPYEVARRFATLDHVSGGRAAWNIVTSQSDDAAANFGHPRMPGHAERYARAEEFVDVVVKLWDSFEDEALLADPVTGRYADPARVHRIDHVGPAFRVRGPLNVPRAPQGRPMIVQAGDSGPSRRLGARWADALFTVQRTCTEAQAFYAQLKGLAAANGRDPDSLVILPGLYTVVGSTQAEARRRREEMDALLDLDVQVALLAERLNVDPQRLTLDRPLPDDIDGQGGAGITSGFVENILREARRENLTVRQLLGRNPFGGHRLVVGTPEQIADNMERWFRGRAADGFNLNMDAYPSGLELFVDHVVPELRRRGLFRTAYEGVTLRSHLGLPRAPSRYAPASPGLVAATR